MLNNKQYLKLTNIENPILIETKKLINLENDFKIQCSKNNKWYLLVTYYDDIKENKQYNICALDPGLRKFMTGIDINANKFKIGDGIMQVLSKLKIKISNLQSSLHKINNKRKNINSKKLYNKWNKCKQMLITSREKFKFKIKELHYQTCNYLCKNYDVIILPNFGVKEMIAKSSKWLRKSILQLSFYEFKERLKNKCKEYNKTFILTEEPYSSKTCSLCENYNFNISKEEYITCNFCKKSYDRDENGALNILKNTLNGVFKSKII
jgi:putative transposase